MFQETKQWRIHCISNGGKTRIYHVCTNSSWPGKGIALPQGQQTWYVRRGMAREEGLHHTGHYARPAWRQRSLAVRKVGQYRSLIRHFRRLGLSVDAKNDEGFTALLMAAKHGYITCAQILIGQGKASHYHRDNKHGMCVEEWLAKKGITLQDIMPVWHDGKCRSRSYAWLTWSIYKT